MSLIKQNDVKNHLSPQFRTKIHLCPSVSLPDATGYSVAEPGTIKTDSANFSEDFFAEHSSSGVTAALPHPATGSVDPPATKVSKSVQA